MSQIELDELHSDLTRKQVLDELVSPATASKVDVNRQSIAPSIAQPQTRKQTVQARVQFAALCWCLFLAGWNDGTLGPLLPRIREVYNVTSLFFSQS